MSKGYKLIIIEPPPTVCDHCLVNAVVEPTLVTVTSATIVDKSWVASGRLASSRCPRCGTLMSAIEHAIPILCEGFTCPVCRTAENLMYQVTMVDADGLKFSATIECATCRKKQTLSKWLNKLLSIVTIKVGPLGISAKESKGDE